MGKLNLLHHKTWHVYSKANRDKVKKDEEKFEAKERESEQRTIKVEQEVRISNLRSKKETITETGHINLFAEEEKSDGLQLSKTEKELDQKKWEDKHTMYLGETKDGKKESPWYAARSSDGNAKYRFYELIIE
jgi:hypothetical protein